MPRDARLLLGNVVSDQRFLAVTEPPRLTDPVVEEEQHHDANDDRRDRFEHEQPLPAREPSRAGKPLHDPPRQRTAEDARDRWRGHEERHHPRSAVARIPVGEIEDDPRKEPRLRDAEDKAQHVERRGNQPPRDHDPRDPDPGADPVQQQVARHFEQEVADEEHAGAGPIDGLTEPEVGEHLEPREPDVHPVQVRDDVTEHQEGEQPPGHLAVGGVGV